MRHPLLAVLVVVAALLCLSLDHGLPHRYVPDDSAVKCALGMARDAGEGRVGLLAALVPPAGHYTTYPYLLPYLDLAAVGASYAAGRVSGRWDGAGAFAEAVFTDASVAWLPARLVTVLLTLLLPVSVYAAALALGRSRGEAALAALLAGSSLLVVQFGHTTRPWAPLTAFWAATLASSLRLARSRGRLDVALACCCAGLAAATHPVGLACFGLPAWALRRWRLRPVAWLPGVGAGLLLALLVGYPYWLVYGLEAGAGAIAGPATPALEIGGQAFDPTRFSGALAGHTALALLGYEPVLLLAGLAGWIGWRRAGLPDGASLVWLPALAWLVLFLLYDGTHVRYLMPLIPVLALGAARWLGAARASGRRGSMALALLALALPLVQAARLDVLLGREDTRTQAARELPGLIAPEQALAVDHFGSAYGPPLMPTVASLGRVERLVGLTRAERRILQAQEPDPERARAVVPLSRFWRFDSYYPSDYLLSEEPMTLQAFLDGWDVGAYVQVDRHPDDRRRQPVTDLMAARGQLIYELSPAAGSGPPAEAALPTAMAFPLTDLWAYRRPGPWIRAWRLARPGTGR